MHLLEGLFAGFVGAMPVGPIWVLCLRHAITGDRSDGIVIGLGGAVADCAYAGVALLGLTVAVDFLSIEQRVLRVCGGAVLIAMGLATAGSRTAGDDGARSTLKRTRLFITALLLALTNPIPILGFAAFLSALGIAPPGGSTTALVVFLVGIFGGSLGWFVVLATAGRAIRRRITGRTVLVFNRIAGALLAGLGAFAVMVGLSAP